MMIEDTRTYCSVCVVSLLPFRHTVKASNSAYYAIDSLLEKREVAFLKIVLTVKSAIWHSVAFLKLVPISMFFLLCFNMVFILVCEMDESIDRCLLTVNITNINIYLSVMFA